MSAETFVDTSFLLRLYDVYQPAKRQAASERWRKEAGDGLPTLSPAILGELYAGLMRPIPRGAERLPPLMPTHAEAARAVEEAARLRVVAVRRETVLEALRLRERHRLGWWDAVHLATACAAGCRRILTEDMPSAPVLEGVTYENPFARA
ncbi:MAG: PIN domain-containing protein [Myxococcales bacterium]|nr:PIN domain-containing protein [Myxococcales bacterium]